MSLNRYFYKESIKNFLIEAENSILGKLARENGFDLTTEARNAWVAEIALLKQILTTYQTGEILFEYSIPRLGKRIDVVLLLKGIVFVLEFKVGAEEFIRQDVEQTWDYALDLKNFHEASESLTIAPILIATHAKESSKRNTFSHYDDYVFNPIMCNASELATVLARICEPYGRDIDLSNWSKSRYRPTPTIIQAASALFLNHSVEDITKTEASAKNLNRTISYIIDDVIAKSRENNRKAICFVTGVPGAGKTLVGLRIAIQQFNDKKPAVYLSGNQPLVEVLSEALARDDKRKEEIKRQKEGNKEKYTLKKARDKVKSFIQIVHHYRATSLEKLDAKKLRSGELLVDPAKVAKHKDDGYSEVEHVAIFDEAQRAWTHQHLAGWLNRKKGIPNFPMSEPEFLIWSLDLREDWAVIVCLVGGGQEINTGEAGIQEWIKALNNRFPNWDVYISDKLTGKEYAEGELQPLLDANKNVTQTNDLHLATSMRSFRAEQLSNFVHFLLEGNQDEASKLFNSFKERYPIFLTRDLNKAKFWLKTKSRGSERYGLVVSSQAQRLRPLAIDVRCKPDTVHWFLDDITDIRSSLFLEDAASEFDVQGLELDWTCLVWDGDLRREKGKWANYSFTGSKWQNIKSPERKDYQINAYRVLMTRARQGMIFCIPEGNPNDHTRKPEFYDGTFEYLKSLGLPVLE